MPAKAKMMFKMITKNGKNKTATYLLKWV
jgi:hypothetical protein